MAIPDFQTLMLPVLSVSSEGEISVGATVERLSVEYGLTDAERGEMLPSGRQTTFANRVHWAKSYLGKAELIALTRRGHFTITPRGSTILNQPPKRIDIRFLSQFPEFESFRPDRRRADGESAPPPAADVGGAILTPDDAMRQAGEQLDRELGADLLSRILASPPAFFERLVVNLLTAMGYGGSLAEAGRALGRSGDDGVDGVIDEDALGLDRIYVQAKRFAPENAVGSGEIRNFFGALDLFKASKGLFVTTSYFTTSAKETARNVSKRVVLVDGDQLTKLMIRYGVGCRIEETLYIKQLDEEFFEPS